MSSPDENDEEFNHTASEPHTSCIFLTLPVAYNCNPDQVTKYVYNYCISWFHLKSSTFPTQTYNEMLNFFRLWLGCGVTQEGHANLWLIWSAQKTEIKN